jgi:hypothetical protein
VKPLTLILAVLILGTLKISDSAAQGPGRLLPTRLQDLSAGLPSGVLAPPDGSDDDYFDQQMPEAAEADPLSVEQIPLGEETELEAGERQADDADDRQAEDADDPDAEQEESEQSKAEAARQRTTRGHLKSLKKPIADIALSAGVNRTDVPENQAASFSGSGPETLITSSGVVPFPDRYTICITHRPLYYEELNLERCGKHHGCLQSVCSGFKFFSNTLLLAYKMGRICPDRLVGSPGDCKTCESFPCTLKTLRKTGCDRHGLLTEAATLAGFSLLML